MKSPDLLKVIKIVIADDHALFRAGVRTALSERKDIELIAEAENGVQLLDMLKTIEPDVVLLDIQMPVMDGLQASMAIRKELHLNMPIVALTANTFSEDVENCFNAGMNDHLGKPYKEEQLIQMVNKWCVKKAV
jgi:CheY-like chemotaxis protein